MEQVSPSVEPDRRKNHFVELNRAFPDDPTSDTWLLH
jgi:hypothetical protein